MKCRNASLLWWALCLAWPAAGAAGGDDARTLQGGATRILNVEAVPPCATVAGGGDSGQRTLEVSNAALTLRIAFELGTARLARGAAQQLDRLGRTLRDPALSGVRFLVAGHTDATGTDAINVPLSCERAIAVRDYLQQRHGLAPERLHVEGFGSTQPLQGTRATQAVNRRVEIRRLESTP